MNSTTLVEPRHARADVEPPSKTARHASTATDLRLRRRRDAAETIVHRAAVLDEEDRALLEAVYDKGHTVQEVARLRGATEPAAVRRLRNRVRRLVTRVSEPRFVFVMTTRQHWSLMRRQVGERCVLRGDSMRQAARTLGLSLHAVRLLCLRIDVMFEAAHDRARAERNRDRSAGQPA